MRSHRFMQCACNTHCTFPPLPSLPPRSLLHPPCRCRHAPRRRADFHPLVDSITYSDYYLLANDFVDYVETQERVDAAYRDRARWAQMSIMSTAGSGFFSSDRTIAEVRAGGRILGVCVWVGAAGWGWGSGMCSP